MKDSGGSESAAHSQLTGMRTQVQLKESNLEDEKSMAGGQRLTTLHSYSPSPAGFESYFKKHKTQVVAAERTNYLQHFSNSFNSIIKMH